MKDISIAERERLSAKLQQHLTSVEKIDNAARLLFKQEGWITGPELQTTINVSRRTLQTWRDNGTISHSKIGNLTVYNILDVMQDLNGNKKRVTKGE